MINNTRLKDRKPNSQILQRKMSITYYFNTFLRHSLLLVIFLKK